MLQLKPLGVTIAPGHGEVQLGGYAYWLDIEVDRFVIVSLTFP
jgi:hypothetical protein